MGNNKLRIVMYHYTRDLKHSRYPEIKGLDAGLLEKQLDFFKDNFNPVTMEQVIDAATKKTELPGDPILLTFDDGYIDNYTCAFPLLEKKGMQGSFFIPGKTFKEHKLLDVNKVHFILAASDKAKLIAELNRKIDHDRGSEFDYPTVEELYNEYAVANRFDDKDTIYAKRILQTALPEKVRNLISSELFEEFVGVGEEQFAYELYMTEDQIRTLKRHGMFIGIHGYDHYWLGKLDKLQMQQDIENALNALDEFVDRNSWVINYPYGNYSDDVISFARENGAVIGLSTEVRTADLLKDNLFALPRYDCNDFPPKSENYKE